MKKQKDKKYQKSDRKICDFGNEIMRKEARKIDIKNAEIYRGAMVSRATFSRHYRNVTDIKIREEERAFREFCRQLKSSDNREAAIFKFVLLIYKNREIFKVLVKRNDIFLLKKMVFRMNRLVMRSWRRYENRVDKEISRLSVHFIIAAVEGWAKRNFRDDLLEDEALLIRRIYDFLEKNQGDLALLFKKWDVKHSRQKRQMVV